MPNKKKKKKIDPIKYMADFGATADPVPKPYLGGYGLDPIDKSTISAGVPYIGLGPNTMWQDQPNIQPQGGIDTLKKKTVGVEYPFGKMGPAHSRADHEKGYPWGNALLYGMLAFDTLLPGDKLKKATVRPEEQLSYNAYKYGTGSQAISKYGNTAYGGGDPVLTPQDFYKSYIKSPKYRKRLQEMGHEDPNAIITDRLMNLYNMDYKGTNGPSMYDRKKNAVRLNSNQVNAYGADNVISHELSHGLGSMMNGIGKPTLHLNQKEQRAIDSINVNSDYVIKYMADNNSRFEKIDKNKMHDSYASEFKADMDALRFKMKRDGIYDAGTQDFNQEFLNKAREKYSKDDIFNRLMGNVKEDKDLIYLMNVIAANKSIPQRGARYGKSAKRKGMKYCEYGDSLHIAEDGTTEELSFNPYQGATLGISGPSHEEGGIDVMANGQPINMEGGEPIFQSTNGDINIMGNMYIPGTKMKFKTGMKKLAKEEQKAMRQMEIADMLMKTNFPSDPMELLKYNAGRIKKEGADLKLQKLAEKKQELADLQNQLLAFSEENNLDPAAFSSGKLKKAKNGITIEAQDGRTLPKKKPQPPVSGRFRARPNTVIQTQGRTMAPPKPVKLAPKPQFAGRTLGGPQDPDDPSGDTKLSTRKKPQTLAEVTVTHKIAKKKPTAPTTSSVAPKPATATPSGAPYTGGMALQPMPPQFYHDLDHVDKDDNDHVFPPIDGFEPPAEKKKDPITFVEPKPVEGTNATRFDYRQLLPEMYALATNKREYVPFQQYRPDLFNPYQVSFQDQLNENQSTVSAMNRAIGNNPAAQSILAGQKYSADSQVLGNEFRTNQAIASDVTNRNTDLLNSAQYANLGLADQQYQRQALAKSKTRSQNHEILKSASEKFLEHDLENRRLKLYENMYNYRFDPLDLRAINRNADPRFDFLMYPRDPRSDKDSSMYRSFLKWMETNEGDGNTQTTTINNTRNTFPNVGGRGRYKDGGTISMYNKLFGKVR